MRVLAATIIVMLAGCAGTIPDEPSTPSVPAVELEFLLGEISKVAANPNGQSEAALTVSPDGQTVLTCFHGEFASLSPGYVSRDSGATFTRVNLPSTAGLGGDCETALLADGSWVFLASTVAGATVMVSQDEGATWSSNPLSAIPVNGLADRPWIVGVENEIWLAYMPLNFQPGTIGFTKSTDHGESWTTPIHVGTPGPTSMVVRHGHMVVGNGTVQIPMVRAIPFMLTGPAATVQVEVATTRDGGTSWSSEVIHAGSDVAQDWPSMALTGSGDRIFIATGSSSSGELLGFHQPPGGQWSEPFVVQEGDGGRPFWPFIDGGTGHNATYIVGGPRENGESKIWIGRIDARDLNTTAWAVAEDGIEFGSVDHDEAGNAYAVWTKQDAQYFVKGSLQPV